MYFNSIYLIDLLLLCAHMCIYMYVCMCVCIYIYMCVCVCVCVREGWGE